MKAAILAEDDSSQLQVLLLVLFGVRTANEEEFVASLAEWVYVGNLKLLSNFVLDITSGLNTAGLLHLLKDPMSKVDAATTREPGLTGKGISIPTQMS